MLVELYWKHCLYLTHDEFLYQMKSGLENEAISRRMVLPHGRRAGKPGERIKSKTGKHTTEADAGQATFLSLASQALVSPLPSTASCAVYSNLLPEVFIPPHHYVPAFGTI